MDKTDILDICIDIQAKKVAKLKAMVDTLNDSAIDTDKCVVGDKHHTFRAQTQNEQELYVKQLQAAILELTTLNSIPREKKFEEGKLGALIKTKEKIYLLATSIGIININSTEVAVLSPISPIGKLFLNKKTGDKIHFRGEEIIIESIS